MNASSYVEIVFDHCLPEVYLHVHHLVSFITVAERALLIKEYENQIGS
jgi:hypothetical protein